MPRTVHILLLLLPLTVFTAALILSVPDGSVHLCSYKLPGTCSLYNTFGIKCATCGMTRAFIYAVHGHWAQATEMNAAWPAAVAGFVIEGIYRVMALAAWPAILPRRLRIAHAVLLVLAAAIVLIHWAFYLISLLR